MKFKKILIEVLKGFFMGIAFLIPGFCAGTVALITKSYNKVINGLDLLLKKFLSGVKILLPIGIGILLGVVAMWYPLKLSAEHFLFAMVCLFGGFVVGSIPSFASNIKREEMKKRHYLYLLIAVLIGLSLGVLSYHLTLDSSTLFKPEIKGSLYLIMIPVGFVSSAGVIIPGISGSMILLVVGFYQNILSIFDNKASLGPAFGALACYVLGCVIGILFFAKLIKFLFSKYKNQTYIWILGLIVGSIFSMFYNYQTLNYYHNHGIPWYEALVGTIFLLGAIIFSYFINNKLKQIKDEPNEEVAESNNVCD